MFGVAAMSAIAAVEATHGAGGARQRSERAARIFAHGIRLAWRRSARGARCTTGFTLFLFCRAIGRCVVADHRRRPGERQAIEVRLGLIQRALGGLEIAELGFLLSGFGLTGVEPVARSGRRGSRSSSRTFRCCPPLFRWRRRRGRARSRDVGRRRALHRTRREGHPNSDSAQQPRDFHGHFWVVGGAFCGPSGLDVPGFEKAHPVVLKEWPRCRPASPDGSLRAWSADSSRCRCRCSCPRTLGRPKSRPRARARSAPARTNSASHR